MKCASLLRFVVWFVAIYALGFGVMLNGPETWVSSIASRMLNTTQEIDLPLRFTGRMLGVYMIFFGAALAMAAWNPVKNRAVLTLAAILLVLRIIQRLVYADQLQSAFGISAQRNWGYIATMAIFVVAVLAYRVLIQKEVNSGATAG